MRLSPEALSVIQQAAREQLEAALAGQRGLFRIGCTHDLCDQEIDLGDLDDAGHATCPAGHDVTIVKGSINIAVGDVS
jgi:hypothetical protein